MRYPEIFDQLLQDSPISLAQWVANPVAAEPAERLLHDIQQRLSSRLAMGELAFGLRLAELILRFWTDQDIEGGHKILLALLPGERERAMLDLSAGQLYIARKDERAWLYLDRGFARAANLLEAEDYFTVLKRHELLRHLALGSAPAEASSLAALLAEARVIARLKGRGTRPGYTGGKHNDTVS